jgi:hypothetical protein
MAETEALIYINIHVQSFYYFLTNITFIRYYDGDRFKLSYIRKHGNTSMN